MLQAPITWFLAIAALVVTGLSTLGGLDMPLPLWPFDHGFDDFPAALHLALNLILLFLLGPRLEASPHRNRIPALTAVAYLAYIGTLLAAEAIWNLDAVGLSGIIWAFVIPAWAWSETEERRRQVRPFLWLMLLWIPLGFAVLVGAGPGENSLQAALLANMFHAVGAVVGLVFAAVSRWSPNEG